MYVHYYNDSTVYYVVFFVCTHVLKSFLNYLYSAVIIAVAVSQKDKKLRSSSIHPQPYNDVQYIS